jgi:hypothetical protein
MPEGPGAGLLVQGLRDQSLSHARFADKQKGRRVWPASASARR